MSYSFDGGGTVALGTQLALGYLALLEPLFITPASVPGPRGPYLRTLRQLPSDPRRMADDDSQIDSDPFWRLLGNMPGGYVVIGDAAHQGSQTYEIDWLFDVRVYIASDWAGRFVEGRLNADNIGDESTDPGVFVMMQHAIELLQAQGLPAPADACTGSITVRSCRHHAVTPAWTMWALDTTIQVIQVIDPDRDVGSLHAIDVNQGVAEKGAISAQRKIL